MLFASMLRRSVAFVALCVVGASAAIARETAPAQSATGTITGVATDETGAAVPEVRIMVTNDATSLRRQITTGAEGTFTLPLLPPGQYTLRAERTGFAPHEIPDIAVGGNDEVKLRVELKVEGLSEGIVVTAQKRGEERLQDVPIPIAVLDADRLASHNVLLLQEYARTIPGMNVTPNYGFSQGLSMRGITTGGFGNPTVGILVDDLPFGASFNGGGGNFMPDFDPGDLARVEALRGPQGTLYGTNSMGGLLKYVLKDPSTDQFSGRIEAGTGGVKNGNGSGYNVRASANIPLSDTWAIRASGFARELPGYIDNPFIGREDVNESRGKGARVSALWRASDALSLKLGALYQRNDGDGVPNVVAQPGVGDWEQNYIPETGGFEATMQVYSALLKAKFGGLELTSATGYNRYHYRNSYDRSVQFATFTSRDFGVTGAPILQDNPTQKFVQEIRFSAPVGGRFVWMAGAFYTHEDSSGRQTIFAADAETGRIIGVEYDLDFPRRLTEYAAFANVTYAVTDRFDIQVGGRQSRTKETDAPFIESGPFVGPSVRVSPEVRSTGDAFTYLVTPRFKPTPGLMLYARIASGYRPGGPNVAAVPANGGPAQYEPDKTQNYEVGLKSNVLGGRVSIGASVYRINWKNVQIQRVLPPPLFLSYQSNGGRAKSEGVELDFAWTPLQGLTISGWLAYNRAVLTEDFVDSPTYGRIGDRLPNTSRFAGYASIEQRFTIGGVAAFAGGQTSYVGDRIGVFQSTATRQYFPAYAITDLRAGIERRSYTVSVFLNNLTDRRGLIGGGIGHVPPFAFIYTQPRAFGLNVSRTF